MTIYLLFTTLISYYFYQYGAALFPLIGMVLMVPFLISEIKPLQANCSVVVAVTFLSAVFSFLSVLIAIHGHWALLPVRAALPVSIFMTGCVMTVALKKYPSELRKALWIVLWVHLICFFLQLIAFLGFGIVIDYLAPVTGEEQRIFGGTYELPLLGSFIRPAGLNNEPGTFVTIVFPLYLLYRIFDKRERKAFGLLDAAMVLAVIFSFSMFGYVFLLIYAIATTAKSLVRGTVALIALSLFFFFIYDFYLYERFAVAADGGLGFRITAMSIFFDQINWSNWFLGYGLLTDISPILGGVAINDVGVWFSLVTSIGIFGFLLFLAPLLLGGRRFNVRQWILLTVLMLSKLSFTYAFFWVIYFSLAFTPRVISISGIRSTE